MAQQEKERKGAVGCFNFLDDPLFGVILLRLTGGPTAVDDAAGVLRLRVQAYLENDAALFFRTL